MRKLTALDEIKVGTKLKIVAKSQKDCYGSVSVKRIIRCENQLDKIWHEVIINRKMNYYFHFENYLAGKSNWVVEVYVLDGTDKRLKRFK